MLEFTVGEFASSTYVNANNMLTQGTSNPIAAEFAASGPNSTQTYR